MASTRKEFGNSYGTLFNVDCLQCCFKNNYTPKDIFAKLSNRNKRVGITIGSGAVGIVAGPIGALIGLAVGAIASNNNYKAEINRINFFNNSNF